MISLFREPSQRTVSSFYYYNKGGCKSETCFKKHLSQNYDLSVNPDGAETMIGCQCKHVLGLGCHHTLSSKKLPAAQAYLGSDSDAHTFANLSRAAVARLRSDYDFVGSTEDFDASVTLIHQMLGGQLDLNTEFTIMNSKEQLEAAGTVKSQTGPIRDSSPSAPLSRLVDAPPAVRHQECVRLRERVGVDLCMNQPDSLFFAEVQRIMLKHILMHHQVPLRLVDTSNSASELVTPLVTSAMEYRLLTIRNGANGTSISGSGNRPYLANITRVLERDFPMLVDHDEGGGKCVQLD
jgi:hypothetical protein